MIRRPIGRTVARTAVVAGTATAVSNRVSRRQETKWDQQAAAQQGAQAPPPVEEAAPASAGPSPDDIEQLKQLAALKDQGILTEEEFAAQKAKILGS
jgi:Short C-terminal domain